MKKNHIIQAWPKSTARAVALLLAATPIAAMAEEDRPAWQPTRVFAQAGIAEHANAAVVGAIWDWSWSKDLRWGLVTGYWDVSWGRWAGENEGSGSSHAWVTQIGITPVLRLFPGGDSRGWYLEGGIGANVLLPVYRTRDKRFSTKFNFGDHVAVGRTFGDRNQHDVGLRFQHFSNAGIKDPNPGENFLQLRYAWRF